MTIVRELLTVIGYDVDEEGAAKADKLFDKLKKGAAALVGGVTAAAGALALVAKQTADTGDDIAKTAARLNVSAEALQELQFAGESAGVPVENMRDALKDLTRNLGEVARGNKTTADTFAQMGVNVRDANGQVRASEDVLGDIAEAFAKTTDPAKQAALATAAMGESGARLAPLLRSGREGVEGLRKEAQLYGAVMDADALKASEDFQDSLLRLETVALSFRNSLGAKLLPIIGKVADETRDWLLANRALIERGIMRTIDVVKTAIEVGKTWGRVIAENSRLLTIFAVVVLGAKVIRAVHNLTLAIRALTIAQIKAAAIPILMGAAFIALAAIIALVIEDIVAFVTGGESAIGNLFDAFVKDRSPGDHWIVQVIADIIDSAVKAIRFIEELAEKAAGLALRITGDAPEEDTEENRQRVANSSRAAALRIARRTAGGAAAAGQRAAALSGSFGGSNPSPATAPARAPAAAGPSNLTVGGSSVTVNVQGNADQNTADMIGARVRQQQESDRRETARILEAQGRIRR